MPTLTRVTSKTKLILKWFGISILCLSLIFVVTKIGVSIKERLAPTSPPAPTVAFGKLPPIAFPISATDKKLTYSLDTITGLLPSLPGQARVYKMAQIKPQFLALDNARQRVYRVALVSSETHLSQNWYQWIDGNFPSREITLNLFSLDFTLSSSFLSDPLAARLTGNFSNVNSAINASQRFLFAMSSFPDDIDLTRTKTLLYSIRDGVLTPETNVSKAQVIRVDFFQGNVDKLPIYYPNPSTSTINLLVTNLQNQELVVGANFHHQPISKKADIYPIKTATQAFNELKAQKAYIASYFGKTSNISIKNIFLGYYIGEGKQNYLLPVVIFEGINGFFAYVSAIRDEWIGS